MIYIGIDTGVNTGIAIWDNKEQSFELLTCTKIHKAMAEVERKKAECDSSGTKLVVRVEDARQRTWFGTEMMGREEERKRLQGVGSVKRDCSIWEDYLKDLGVEYEMVAPKRNITKMTHEYFKAVTGWSGGRTNEHTRDAAMLVVGF